MASFTVATATLKCCLRSSLVPSRSPVASVPEEIWSSSSRASASARERRESLRLVSAAMATIPHNPTIGSVVHPRPSDRPGLSL